jgi:acyl dehydratase
MSFGWGHVNTDNGNGAAALTSVGQGGTSGLTTATIAPTAAGNFGTNPLAGAAVFGGGYTADKFELGINYALVVHGEQRFEYTRPLRAGDVVTAQSTIESIREVGSNVLMNTRTELRTVAGEVVCTAFSIIVERGGVGLA